MTARAVTTPAPTFTLTGTWSESALSALADILLRGVERDIAAEREHGQAQRSVDTREDEDREVA